MSIRRPPRLAWEPIIAVAHALVTDATLPVTLRSLHYQLVSRPELGYPNTLYAYKRLSDLTAQGRRDGTFAELADFTRGIERPASWDNPRDALEDLIDQYRRDRTAGQAASIYVGVEKRTLVPLLTSLVGDQGIPVLPLGGYASQAFIDRIRRDAQQGRPAVLLYCGDWDSSGVDIQRDLIERTDGTFGEVQRIALTAEQVADHNLPVAVGKSTDSRSAAFKAQHGALVQVELEALPPATLADLVQDAVAAHWDTSQEDAVLAAETADRVHLAGLIDGAQR